MKEKKEYNIDSFEKLLNIMDEDNFENLLIDFAKFCSSYLAYVKGFRDKYPKETKNKHNSQILKVRGFTWIDDGKHELRFVKIENVFTGEIHNMKVDKVPDKDL